MTFEPYAGPDNPFLPRDGKLPVEAWDYDSDGIPDGIEDLNADGVWNGGELDWQRTDTDGDGISDGREARIFGARLDDMLKAYLPRGLTMASAIAFDPNNLWETDANDPDTDEDGVPDGKDINPRNNAVIQIAFKTFQQIMKVESCCGAGQWAPDLIVRLTVDTPAGTITFRTPAPIKNVYAKEETGLGNYITEDTLKADPPTTVIGGPHNLRNLPTKSGIITIDLTDDVSEMPNAADRLGEISLRLELEDEDFGDNDILDISRQTGERAFFDPSIDIVRDLGKGALEIDADGSGDGSTSTVHEDDARIKLDVISNFLREFFEAAQLGKAVTTAQTGQPGDPKGESVPPPFGQCFGYGGC